MSESTSADVAGAVAAGANWRRAGGFAGAAIGVLAAGAAAGVAVERLTVGRGMRKKARLALDASGPYGSLRGMPGRAVADDGTEIYYEVDETGPEASGPAPGYPAAGPPVPSRSSSRTATASARTPGTSSARRCAASSVPSTGTSAATAGHSAAGRRPTAYRSPSTSSAAT